MLPLNSYFSYDNWKLYPNGSRILTSQFRNSWRVTDTGALALGYSDVAIVVDSTFLKGRSGADTLVHTEQRYFRTSSNGDVFEYGFIARLVGLRDSVLVIPKWDRLFSPSAGANTFWVVETNDSATTGTIYGTYLPILETVEASINGVSNGVLSYHVEITGRNLAVHIWVSNSPSAFLRLWDQSEVLYNRGFQELRVMRTGG